MRYTHRVTQNSILGPILYQIYTADLATNKDTISKTDASDTADLSVHSNPETASFQIKNQLTKIEKWYKQWRTKVNQTSPHVLLSHFKKKPLHQLNYTTKTYHRKNASNTWGCTWI
ncbi:hypothetical protein EVAR_34403_1 [Eumeta japonica]|uniref:Uncharacterized protein n=1 Tax=Eumeta variegata TaxID=151549 RepID=A0A4C1WVW0_EUMVA|nr:hypothetical protein EVAR_34403_1 [Eumeta japonica]